MIANTAERDFDVIEITNEMPQNRIGGVGSVIESLASGFGALGVRALWYLTDHEYQPFELDAILAQHPAVAIGGHHELGYFRAPVVHVHSYHHAPGLLQAVGRARTVFTVHSLLACEEWSNDVDLRGPVLEQERLIGSCDMVALVSAAEHDYYRRLGYERLNPRVRVVHNGIRPPAQVQRRRRRAVLGYCGRLVPRKRPEHVQMVLGEPGFEACEVLIAGKAFSRYARDLMQSLGLENRVRYLGWCGGPRLEAFFEAIDVLVQSSSYEPFGLAALEAAARGIPVICTPVDGLVEVLGEHAFYAEDTSYEGFRAAAQRWRMADEAELRGVACGARRRALAHFTDIAMAERYVRCFGEFGVPADPLERGTRGD